MPSPAEEPPDAKAHLHDRNTVYDLPVPPVRSAAADDGGGLQTPGYEIERRLAEGGMGRVWVARDGQVGRQVALKELLPEHEDDDRLRERFLAEARITGQLEHPGIVPVYQVLERPGRSPAYAMRLIRGLTLLEAVREFHAKDADAVARRDLLQAFVAVCNTLAYAHSRGVLHRDLKGENVVLGPFGEVLVLDWGLAKVVGEAEPAVRPLPGRQPEATADGAIAGTAGYMAPEQARGETDHVDVRSDVFGLGAVLYLILTGRPPYAAANWVDVLLQAQEGRVRPPRQFVRRVPKPLEAVCLRALAERREDRYPGAAELADDVKRWLAGEPVTACPEPLVARAGRWLRKNRVLASAAAAAVLVALGAAGWFGYQDRQREQARLAAARERDREAEVLLGEIEGLREAARQVQPALAKVQFNHALGRAERAAALLAEGGEDDGLRERVERVREELRRAERDQEMVVRLEEARLTGAEVSRGDYDRRRRVQEYQTAFAWYLGEPDVRRLSAGEVAGRLDESTVKADLAAALDDWASHGKTKEDRVWAGTVASRLDDDPFRRQMRTAWERNDRAELARVARSGGLSGQPPGTLDLLARMLRDVGEVGDVERVLREAQLAYPGDFWINHNLGICLRDRSKPEKHGDAVRFLTAAVALRSRSAGAHVNLGNLLSEVGRLEEAERAYRRAINLQPDDDSAHVNLGIALARQDRPTEAEAAFRRAVALRPDDAAAHAHLGRLLAEQNRPKEAEDALLRAITLEPDDAKAHFNLGNLLSDNGRPREAEKAYRRAVALDRDFASAHHNLGKLLFDQGMPKEAEVAYRRAVALKTGDAKAHSGLGNALDAQGRHEEAEKVHRRAIKLGPDDAEAHNGLGGSLFRQRRWKEAEQAFRRAIQLRPKFAAAHYNLGVWLFQQGQYKESLPSFRRYVDLLPPASPQRPPVVRLIQQTEHLVALDVKLAAVVAGDYKPANDTERVDLADLAQQTSRRRYVTATALYARAFQTSPGLAAEYRYNAAWAAALAGTGQGNDAASLDATDRAQLRYAALGWLRDDLAALATRLTASPPDAKAREALRQWRADADLAAVRDRERLAKLPEAEQVAWGNLWAQVESLLGRHRSGK